MVLNIWRTLPRYFTTLSVTKAFSFISMLTYCDQKTVSHRKATLWCLKIGQRKGTKLLSVRIWIT